ncbi:MAG: DHH family phosphoesterase, partial [Verrucomicrobiota bacterium]
MNELQKPQIILTHESDLDGLVSGCLLKRLAQHLFGEDVPLAAYHLAPWQSRQMLEHVAWVSDLSMEARLDREGWLVVDHHPAKHQPTKARYHFDSQQCAASLAYQ